MLLLRSLFIVFACLLIEFTGWAESVPRLERLESYSFDGVPSGKTSVALKNWRHAPVDSLFVVWVQFRDKGFHTDREFAEQKAREEKLLPARTLRRRSKMLPRDSLIRVDDLALDERYVNAVLSQGARLRARSRWFNAISVEASGSTLDRIARLPFVHRVAPVARRRTSLLPSSDEPVPERPGKGSAVADLDYGLSATQVLQIHVDQLHALGLSGSGVIVGVLDAGFAPFSIEALDHAPILGERDFVDRDHTTFDTPEHGTSVLSVLGGFAPGKLIGPAYGASFLLARTEIVEDGIEIQLEEDLWVEGLEWLEREGVDVVNSSLGYTDWYSPEDFDGNTAVTTLAADAAVERGVFIANSVGNEGTAGLTVPADGFNVCAAGGVTASGIPWTGSSRGPTADGRIKPDVAALAVNARVARSLFRDRVFFDSAYDPRQGPADVTATYGVGPGRATLSFWLALALKDDATDDVAWLGKPVGDFSGVSVALVRAAATQELWVNGFSGPGVLTADFPGGFGYNGDTLRFVDGGIETTPENRFDIVLLLGLTPVLPEGGLLEGDQIIVRTTSRFSARTGLELSTLDDTARRSYGNGTGTSFASPLVAGAAALILEARPGWTPLQVLEALRSTASQSTAPDNAVGYGIVNAHRALFESAVPPSADIDGSGSVGEDDLYLFLQDWTSVRTGNETVFGPALRSDLNLDGVISDADLFVISGQWGR